MISKMYFVMCVFIYTFIFRVSLYMCYIGQYYENSWSRLVYYLVSEFPDAEDMDCNFEAKDCPYTSVFNIQECCHSEQKDPAICRYTCSA